MFGVGVEAAREKGFVEARRWAFEKFSIHVRMVLRVPPLAPDDLPGLVRLGQRAMLGDGILEVIDCTGNFPCMAG
jgi:hypothetical protein